jgi:hypothetical protein
LFKIRVINNTIAAKTHGRHILSHNNYELNPVFTYPSPTLPPAHNPIHAPSTLPVTARRVSVVLTSLITVIINPTALGYPLITSDHEASFGGLQALGFKVIRANKMIMYIWVISTTMVIRAD